MDTKSKIEPNPEAPVERLKPEKFAGKIEFKDVHFTYPSVRDKEVLCGLSFVVEPGQKVALVGAAGCGKSRWGHYFGGRSRFLCRVCVRVLSAAAGAAPARCG